MWGKYTIYVFVTRVCRVRMMTRLTHNKASHHLCDECLLPATRQSTALMIVEVDFSKLWQFIFLPHLNYFVVVALHCTHTHDIEPLPRITVFGSLPQSIYQFKLIKYVLMAELWTFFEIYCYDLWRKMPTNQPHSKMVHCFPSIVFGNNQDWNFSKWLRSSLKWLVSECSKTPHCGGRRGPPENHRIMN